MYAEGARVSELPLPKLGPVPNECVEFPRVRRPRRRMFRMLPYGCIPGYAPICLDSNDPETVIAGARKRVLRETPVPDAALLREFALFVRAYVLAHYSAVNPLDFEEWLASCSGYNEERKLQLRRCAEQMVGPPSFRQCSHVDSFIKTEFYPEFKFPRWINSRCDEFKVYSGPAFKAIEEQVYKDSWFIKHVAVPERPKLVNNLRQAGLRYFATDYTSFEAHFSPEFMQVCECTLYRHCLSNHPLLAERICQTLTGPNRCRTRTGVRLTVQGRRMSGDMCTSLGNGFSNLMMALFAAHKAGTSITGFVEGDDGIFACHEPLTESIFTQLGFAIKIIEVADPSLASFCGIVSSPSGHCLRSPTEFCQGFGWTSSFINAGDKIMMELLRAKALSAVYEMPHCPIVSVLARSALEKTRGCVPRFVNDGYHTAPRDELHITPFQPTYADRETFQTVFGISVEIQLLVEAAISAGDMSAVAKLMPAPADVEVYATNYVVET